MSTQQYTKSDLVAIAARIAATFNIDAALVCAMCEHESSWNHLATRYEPAFYQRYISSMKGLSPEEMHDRAVSFGLMQIMGQVAREQGFTDPLRDLCEPEKSVRQGCIKLRKCLNMESHEHGTYKGDVSAALLRYNGGGDARYPVMVLEHYDDYIDQNPRYPA